MSVSPKGGNSVTVAGEQELFSHLDVKNAEARGVQFTF